MYNKSVVFVVGDDIVNQLSLLPSHKVMDYIIGNDDVDYFEKHFISIEEIGDYWKCIFDLLSFNQLNILEYFNVIYEDNEDIIILVNKEMTGYVLETIEKISVNELNHFFKDKYKRTKYKQSAFENCLECMKKISRQAILSQGTLLFCIDKT